MEAAAQQAPSQRQARRGKLFSRGRPRRGFFVRLYSESRRLAGRAPWRHLPTKTKKDDQPDHLAALSLIDQRRLRQVRRPRNRGLDPLFVRAMTWTVYEFVDEDKEEIIIVSRSLIRQGNDLDLVGAGYVARGCVLHCLDPLFVRAMTWTAGLLSPCGRRT